MIDEKTLLEECLKARALSYSPYSKFAVGAVVVAADGSLYRGANIENASYPLTMCAERNAIYQAYLAGHGKEELVLLALVAESPYIVSPCGACRQVMSELLNPETPVYLFTTAGQLEKTTVAALLPLAFTERNLQ